MTPDDRTEDITTTTHPDHTGPAPYTGPDPARVHHPAPDHVTPGALQDTRNFIRKVPRRIWLTVAIVAALAFSAGVGVIALTNSASAPAAITVHGTEMVCANLIQDGGTASATYPDITDGTQVIITDSSGKVLGTGTLSLDPGNGQARALSILPGESVNAYTFTAHVPGGLQRYGISAGHSSRGTIYFSAREMKDGPGVQLGC